MTASLHDEPALAREERVARCRRKGTPTLVVPGHARESHQRRLAASDFSKQVGNVVLRQMSEGERRPAGTLDLHNGPPGAHSVTAPTENFCREPSHGRHEPKRPDQLPSPQGFAARAALDQKSERGPSTHTRGRLSAEIRKALSSRLAFGVNLGEVGDVDSDMPRPPRTEPHRETLDGSRGHAAVTRAVHFEDRSE